MHHSPGRNEMKWKCIDYKCVRKPTKSRFSLTQHYGGKDLPKSQVLSSEWNTERVRDDASGDSEDGEDDELPCVIGESEGDCVWRGSRRSVGSSFHRHGAAYRKELLVILKEDRVGGRARVTIDEERVLWQGWTEIKLWRTGDIEVGLLREPYIEIATENGVHHVIITAAVHQCRCRLSACVNAGCGHSEHRLWLSAFVWDFCCRMTWTV